MTLTLVTTFFLEQGGKTTQLRPVYMIPSGFLIRTLKPETWWLFILDVGPKVSECSNLVVRHTSFIGPARIPCGERQIEELFYSTPPLGILLR